jgi:AraC-like DNA-binding protein
MVSYAAVLALLFCAVAIYMNQTYAQTIRENTIDSNINRLNQIRMQNENIFSSLYSISNQISLAPYIRPFRFLKTPMEAFYLKMQLAPYAYTSPFVSQLFIIFHEDDFLYSVSTSMSLDLFVNELMRLDGISPDELRAMLRAPSRTTILPSRVAQSALLEGRHERVVAAFIPLGVGATKNTGTLLFLVKESFFQQIFADEVLEPRNTYILYGDSILASSQKSLSVPEKLVLDALSASANSRFVSIKAEDGRSYLLVAQSGPNDGMRYAALIPEETLRQNTLRAQIGITLFLFALSLPCLALIYYLAQRQVRPIRELRGMFAAPSQADDFQVIRSGIAHLVGQNAVLSDHLDASQAARKSDFVLRFVKGRYATRADAVLAARRVGIDADRGVFALSLIAQANPAVGLNMDKLLSAGGDAVSGYGVEQQSQVLCALFAQDGQSIERWAERAKAFLESQECAPVTMALSGISEDFQKAAGAYLEVCAAYDLRFVMGAERVLRFRDVTTADQGIRPIAHTYVNGFRQALRYGDAQGLSDCMDDLIRYLGSSEMSLFAFRMIYNQIIGALLSEHITRNDDTIDALEYSDIFTLTRCQSIADLDKILRKICATILSRKKPALEQAPPYISEIVAAMQERYADPNLNMSALAELYDITPARLSLTFKTWMGSTPSDYLLNLRIEKAQELLKATDYSIKEICALAGYYEPSGFIRRFKQQTGLTPAQYRRRARGEHMPCDESEESGEA